MSNADIVLTYGNRLAEQTRVRYDSRVVVGQNSPEALSFLPCSIAFQETARCGVWR